MASVDGTFWPLFKRLKGYIEPVVPFADAAGVYELIDSAPERVVKVGISYP